MSQREWDNQSLWKKIKRSFTSPKEEPAPASPSKAGVAYDPTTGQKFSGTGYKNYVNSQKESSGGSSLPKSPYGSVSEYKDMFSDDGYEKAKKIEEEKKEEYEKMMKKRKNQYGERYDELSDMIRSRIPEAESDRDAALSDVDAELKNLITKMDVSRGDTKAYFGEQKEDLKSEHEKANKELARIFQARGASDSSYFMEKLQESQTEFEKTLSRLGDSEARKYSEIDADMTYYQTQAISKRSEIEKAYNQTIRSIQEDLTKTSWEKEDAFQKLDEEFMGKMEAIDQRIMEYTFQQQEFRNEVAKWSYDNSFKSQKWGEEYGMSAAEKNEAMKMGLGGDTLMDALKNSVGEDGKVDPDAYARLRSASDLSADQFDKKYGYLLSSNEQSNLGLGGNQTKWKLESEIWQDLGSPDAADMSDAEKAAYIRSRGADPKNFGIYS